MFAISLGTYMSSKEVFVYEHDFYCGIAVWGAFILLANKVGPGLTKYLDAVSSRLRFKFICVRIDAKQG